MQARVPKKYRRAWIAVNAFPHEGMHVEDGTRVCFTKPAAEREAKRISHGEVVELWVPRASAPDHRPVKAA